MEDDQGGDPQNDAEAPGNDAVGVTRANWAAEGALERERQDGDGSEEVCGGDCKKHNGGCEVGVGGPCHG